MDLNQEKDFDKDTIRVTAVRIERGPYSRITQSHSANSAIPDSSEDQVEKSDRRNADDGGCIIVTFIGGLTDLEDDAGTSVIGTVTTGSEFVEGGAGDGEGVGVGGIKARRTTLEEAIFVTIVPNSFDIESIF